MLSRSVRGLKPVRKIKVLGYPFAGGQGQSGVELTPAFLQQQAWFKAMCARSDMHVEYQEIKVTDVRSNSFSSDEESSLSSEEHEEAKNIQNVVLSSQHLSQATAQAIREGFFPVVLGGDHSQAIGSIHGAKQIKPDCKLLWLDAHIDANTPMSSPSGNAHGMPVSFLSGLVPFHRTWNCVDIERDLCYFGIRSYEADEEQLIRDKRTLVFESHLCQPENLDYIHRVINAYFMDRLRQPVRSEAEIDYWVSFDIDGVDAREFGSTGTSEYHGMSMDYINSFMRRFLPRSLGMDFTEVNFSLAKNKDMLLADQQTFREIIELIVDCVNTVPYEIESNKTVGTNMESAVYKLK